jgi:hypothetical protein
MTATDVATHRLERRERGTGHTYTLDGHKVPGVTTVLGALAKPALTDWAARLAAEYAVDEWDRLGGMPPTQRLTEIRGAHRRRSESAMSRGRRIHRFGELIASGRPVEVPDELDGPVTAYARFLDEWDITATHTEMPVAHTRYRYGGTLDAIVTAPRLGTVLLDIKTGGVFPEVALQLAGYRYADICNPDGTTAAMPELDGCYVAHVMNDAVELIPVLADEITHRTFLYLLSVYRWTAGAKGNESPIGQAIHPED